MAKISSRHILFVIILSFCIALIWTYATRHMYNYNQPFAIILDMSLFPVVGWTLALTIGYAIGTVILTHFVIRSFLLQLSVICLFYFIAVIIAETAGYHLFNIHNLGTGQYAGLPVCDCLHAPVWMQWGYFILGPLHWLLAKIIIATPNLWYSSVKSDRIV